MSIGESTVRISRLQRKVIKSCEGLLGDTTKFPDNEAFSRLKEPKKPVFMRVFGIAQKPKFTSLHQTYIKRCRKRCRDEKIADFCIAT